MLLSLFTADRDRRLGLQTLIAAADNDDVARGSGGNVATRTISASRLAVSSCLGLGGEPDPEPLMEEEEDEEGVESDGGKEGGCWVLYGWRRRLRRLPPAIPSLRRALTRTRTADGRVVVSREPAPRRACRVVATRLEGRLVLDLVEPSPVPPPPHQRPSFAPQEADDDAPAADDEEEEEVSADYTATGMISARRDVSMPAAVRAATIMASPVGSASSSPVPAVGCFEAVIRVSPLRKTMPVTLPRMVH
ncbi:hypothetical protein BRADI_1g45390v3 [Brachypodium distachyon]|uniref:FAF domain-containing protein n=1 Tax=Brachypodium distachyon TaxID=15368 RepID=I1GZM2_BRADI|nr:hypothetical protein BRADI_1g45390v3 [Brachypodium distachyon]